MPSGSTNWFTSHIRLSTAALIFIFVPSVVTGFTGAGGVGFGVGFGGTGIGILGD
jgi:hypothetical protein